MSEPIDIKTKKIIPQPVKQGFEKSIVHEALKGSIISHWDTWGKLQSSWTNRAYKTFKDFDKYLVLIYLIRDNWQQSANKFEYYSFEDFYKKEKVVLDKINLIKISEETVDKKIVEISEV